MSSVERRHKSERAEKKEEQTVETEEECEQEECEEDAEQEECEEDAEQEECEEDAEEEDGCAIDLSQNEVYRGVCTLFEDAEGNNILEYISLLHTELIGINKSMENLRGIRKDLSRLADVAELILKGKKDVQVPVSSGSSVVSSASSRQDKSERSKK